MLPSAPPCGTKLIPWESGVMEGGACLWSERWSVGWAMAATIREPMADVGSSTKADEITDEMKRMLIKVACTKDFTKQCFNSIES